MNRLRDFHSLPSPVPFSAVLHREFFRFISFQFIFFDSVHGFHFTILQFLDLTLYLDLFLVYSLVLLFGFVSSFRHLLQAVYSVIQFSNPFSTRFRHSVIPECLVFNHGEWVDDQSVVNCIPDILARSLGLVNEESDDWLFWTATGEEIPSASPICTDTVICTPAK